MTDRDEAPARRLRWWFPAAFVLATAAVAFVALSNLGDAGDPPPPSIPDLAELSSDAPAVEELAPDFSVPTVTGDDFTLSGHLAVTGRPVLLNLWATWCAPCRAEMPLLQATSEAHPEIEFVGVAIDDGRDAVTAFVEEVGVDYVIGLDEDNAVRDAYPVLGMPATFVIAADGTIVQTHIGILTEDTLAELIAAGSGA